MKNTGVILIAATISLFSWIAPAPAAELTPEEKEELARNRALAQEALTFQTAAAQNARNPGSPVGNAPQKVTICFRGKTQIVPEPALPPLLKQGAKLGPCPTKKASS